MGSSLVVMQRVFSTLLRGLWTRMVTALPPSRGGKILFGILLGLGIVLRLAGLDWGIPRRDNASSVYHDEGHQLAFVEMDWKTFRSSFGFYELARPVMFLRVVGRPLFALGRALGLDDGSTRVFELVTLRSIMAGFAIAGLLAVYALGRAVGTTGTGLWALGFLAVMPGPWYYAHVIKGDSIIATLFVVLLLVAIRLVEDGRWRSYLAAGAIQGFGTALKITMLATVPALLVAHILHAVRLRSFRALVAPKGLAAVVLAIAVFFSLYPYPFINAPLFQKEIGVEIYGPTSSLLTFRAFVDPATYAAVWRQYNIPDRPFMDMIFGRFLRAALLPTAAAAAVAGVWRLFRYRDARLFLAVVFAAAFGHSLTFAPALDDRYVLSASPYVALFAALAASAAWLPSARPRLARVGGVLLGALLLIGTAAIAGKLFPMLVSDPREGVVQWISAHAEPRSAVAQLSLLARWATVLDQSRVVPVALVMGEGLTRRVARLTQSPYVLLQREPWNYDHTFRYEREGIEGQLASFLRSYDRVETFGREPTLLGQRLPRNLGAPVIDVYRRLREPTVATKESLLPAGGVELPVSDRAVTLLGPARDVASLQGAALRVSVDIRGLNETWRAGSESEPIRVGVLALWDGASPPETFRDLPGGSTFVTKDAVWTWLMHFRPADVEALSSLTFAIDHPSAGTWDFYEGRGGGLAPASGSVRAERGTVRFAVMALSSGPPLGTVRVDTATLERFSAP